MVECIGRLLRSGEPKIERPDGCLGYIPSLKVTANAPENGWLEYDPFLLDFGLFSGAFWLVSGSVNQPLSGITWWWFQISFIFAQLGCPTGKGQFLPIPGEMIQFDEHIFQVG